MGRHQARTQGRHPQRYEKPNMNMTCTRCGADTPGTIDMSATPLWLIKDLCEHWLCSDCLDVEEREDLSCENAALGIRAIRMKRQDYRKAKDGIGSVPERRTQMYCDECRVQWSGCWDSFECPECGEGEPPWLQIGDLRND